MRNDSMLEKTTQYSNRVNNLLSADIPFYEFTLRMEEMRNEAIAFNQLELFYNALYYSIVINKLSNNITGGSHA